VATVVLKLFNIVKPGSAYFGMKDFQQLQVIRTMVRDLNMDVRIVPCPTVREPDGLAMSSRNAYLSPEERRDALCVSRALKAAESLFLEGETSGLRMRSAMEAEIAEVQGANPDYISVVDPDTLRDVDEVGRTCLGILAVKIGKTRLIDNMLFTR
jgi:pantoate--beta-alanine ligase